MKKRILSIFLALALVLTACMSGTVTKTAKAADGGAITLQYRYGTNNLIQVNTNLPSSTPCVNFLATDNGCNIAQSGDQTFGWAGMDNVDGTIVITFHFNAAFEANQTYTVSKGAVFGFTDGNTYTLDKDYTFTFDGSNWSMEAKEEIGEMSLAYRYGTNNLIQVNTDLPATTAIANFLATDNGCNLTQGGNQTFGWAGMDNVDGTIVLTFNFNNAFTEGQTYTLAAGSLFGFSDGTKYALKEDYVFTFNGTDWAEPTVPEEPEIGTLSFEYSYGTNNLIQVKTDLPTTTPIANFTTGENGCSIDESANTVQWVGWIGMATDDAGTIYLSFNFNNAFTVGQSYVLPGGAIFGFSNGEKYALNQDYVFTFNGTDWADVPEHVCVGEAVDAVEPTCIKPGNIAYWACECGKVYADANGIEEITIEDTVIEPIAHEIVHQNAIEPGCHYNGQIEHWYCSECGTFWADEARTQITNALSVVLPATKDGELVHVEAKEPTCKAEGNIEYWHCKDCEQFWQNEALTQLTNVMNVKLGTTDHKAVKLPAKAAEVGKTGLTEGSKCSVCGDVLVKQETIAALKLAAPKASKVTKATGGKKKITVKFKKVSGVTRYEIQIATKKNMKKGLKTYQVTKANDMKNGKYVVKKLKAKKTYYVRIRTVKTVNGVTKTSKWSKVVKATKTK